MELTQEYQKTSEEHDLLNLKDEIIKLPQPIKNFYAPIFNLCTDSYESAFLKDLRLIVDKLELSFASLPNSLQENEWEIKKQEFIHLKAAIDVAALIKEDLSLYLLCQEIVRAKANALSQDLPWNQLQSKLKELFQKYPDVLESKGISKGLIVKSFQIVYQKLCNLYNQFLSLKNDNLELQQTVNSYLTYYDLNKSLVERLQNQSHPESEICKIFAQQAEILKAKLNQVTAILKAKEVNNLLLVDKNMMLSLQVERLTSENTTKEKKISELRDLAKKNENTHLASQQVRHANLPQRNQLLSRHLFLFNAFTNEATACKKNMQEITDRIELVMSGLELKIKKIH